MGEWEKEGKCYCTGLQLRVRIHFNLHTYNVSGSLNAVRRRTLEFGKNSHPSSTPLLASGFNHGGKRVIFSSESVRQRGEQKKLRILEGIKILRTRVQGFSSCKIAIKIRSLKGIYLIRFKIGLRIFNENEENVRPLNTDVGVSICKT